MRNKKEEANSYYLIDITPKIVAYKIKYFGTLYKQFSLWKNCLFKNQNFTMFENANGANTNHVTKKSQSKHRQNKPNKQ